MWKTIGTWALKIAMWAVKHPDTLVEIAGQVADGKRKAEEGTKLDA